MILIAFAALGALTLGLVLVVGLWWAIREALGGR